MFVLAIFFAFMLGITVLLSDIALYGDNIFSASFIVLFVLSALLWVPSLYILIQACRTWHFSNIKEYFGLFSSKAPDKDNNEVSALTTTFKDYLKRFYGGEKLIANDAGISSNIQTIVNQSLFNLLTLHKDRLKANNLTLDIDIQRKRYGDSPSLTLKERFVAAYKNTAVYEEIYSVRKYRSKDKLLKKIVNKEIVHYSVAEKQDFDLNDKMYCPNCGAESSYAGLLDGCDYCDAKFRIKDLKRSITAFAFRADFQTKYDKFDALGKKIFAAVSLIYVVLNIVCSVALFSWAINQDYGESELIFIWIGAFWGTALLMAITVVTIVPVSFLIYLSIGKIIIALTKDKLADSYIKQQQHRATRAEKRIRAHDKNFVISLFLSEIQTKISILLMADNVRTIDAFTDFDASSLSSDKSIVDVLFDDLEIINYQVDDSDQYIRLRAKITLLKKVGNRLKTINKRKTITARKKIHYQETGAFFELKCPMCGASLSTLDGKFCSSCRSELDISQYEWMIASMR